MGCSTYGVAVVNVWSARGLPCTGCSPHGVTVPYMWSARGLQGSAQCVECTWPAMYGVLTIWSGGAQCLECMWPTRRCSMCGVHVACHVWGAHHMEWRCSMYGVHVAFKAMLKVRVAHSLQVPGYGSKEGLQSK
eukprot:1162100-Pelagomonas_calceolata.AAC.18